MLYQLGISGLLGILVRCLGTDAIITMFSVGLICSFTHPDGVTGRPVFAQIKFCSLGAFDLESDVAIAAHELMHALVRAPHRRCGSFFVCVCCLHRT